VELNRALSLKPDLKQAHASLYNCYIALGDAEQAAKHRRLATSGN